jgi:hypothetical protein
MSQLRRSIAAFGCHSVRSPDEQISRLADSFIGGNADGS